LQATVNQQDLKHKYEDELRQSFIIRQTGLSKEKAEFFTPACIKALKPPVEGAVLCWQYSRSTFQGYMKIPPAKMEELKTATKRRRMTKTAPVPTHWSCSRKYGLVRTKVRSQIVALQLVVDWMWKVHFDHGGDSCT
jgi:hypothetical protein